MHRMRVAKVVKWALLVVVLTLLLAAGMIYWQASRQPADYAPAQLAPAQRQQVAEDFINRQVLGFLNKSGEGQPFTITLGEDQLNRYLASMDEIAASRPGGRTGEVVAAMAQAGLADPSVSLGDGRLRLMIRSTRYDKVVGVEILPSRLDDGRISLRTGGATVGRALVPRSVVADQLARVKDALAASAPRPRQAATQGGGDVSAGELAGLMRTLLGAIDGEPAELVFRNRARVDDVRVTPDGLSIRMVPLAVRQGGTGTSPRP
jgi:hypothetical protein